MSYLASFKQKTVVGEVEAALRIPTADLVVAALVCVELNRTDGVSGACIEGEEAPRRTNNKNHNGGAR